MFKHVNPPVLKTLTRPAIVKFETDYRRYLRFHEINANLIKQKPLPLLELIEPKTARNLKDFFLEETEELTEETIRKYFDKVINEREKISFMDFEENIRTKLKMNLKLPDSYSRIADLIEKHAEIVEDAGYSSDFFKNNTKLAVMQLCHALHPPEFSAMMLNHLRSRKWELKKNYRQFCKYVIESSIHYNYFNPKALCSDASCSNASLSLSATLSSSDSD